MWIVRNYKMRNYCWKYQKIITLFRILAIMKNNRKTITKIFLYTVGLIVLVFFGLVASLWIMSPDKADPIKGPDGKVIPKSISTIEKITLGGIEQYLIIRGVDSTKPVMLFLHGGPGSPEFTFMKTCNRAIENDFVMVYWEQRGAGKSYSRHIPVESMNLGQFISDTRELSKILAKRFHQEKIFLMGHSWGSLLGILTVYKYPELFHAYFGIGQVCCQYKAERISFEWVKEQANKQNDRKAMEKLSKMTFPDSLADSEKWTNYLMSERAFVSRFGGGVTHQMKSLWPFVKGVLAAKEYSLSDKFNYMTASKFSLKYLWSDALNANLFNQIDSMQVPVYIFQGKYDYQTSYSVAKDFFDQLKAPEKEFFTFENAAHSPVLEDVDKFNSIVKEKVEGMKSAK